MKNEPPAPTAREIVERERAAFIRGATWRHFKAVVENHDKLTPVVEDEYQQAAGNAFRLPQISRPRVVRDPSHTTYGPASGHSGDLHWCSKNGRLHAVDEHGICIPEWEDDQRRDSYPTPERVRVWADLLANPTELVDE